MKEVWLTMTLPMVFVACLIMIFIPWAVRQEHDCGAKGLVAVRSALGYACVVGVKS